MKKLFTPAIALIASALSASLMFGQGAPLRPPVAGAPPASRQGESRRAFGDSTRGPQGMAGRPSKGGGPASHLLRARRQLDLSDEQVKKLEALAFAAAPTDSRSDMMRAQADMMDATKGDGNLAAARAALDKMSRLRNDASIARLKSRQDMRAILTPTQKAKYDKMGGMMRERTSERRKHSGSVRRGSGMGHQQKRFGQQMGPGQPMGSRNRQASPMPPNGQ